MNFVTGIIKEKVTEVRTLSKSTKLPSFNDWLNSQNTDSSSNDPISELFNFSYILETLREFQMNYKQKAFQSEPTPVITPRSFLSPEKLLKARKTKLAPRELFKSPSIDRNMD